MTEEKTIEQEMEELDDVLDSEMEKLDEESADELEEDAEETETEEESSDNSEETSNEEAETEEEKETSDGKTEVETDDRYAQLLSQINDLQGQLKTSEKPPEETSENLVDYMKDISMDDLDIETLNNLLNRVAQSAQKNAQENYSKQLPGIINGQIDNKLSSQEIVNQFYSANKDLKNVRNVVKACAAQISQEHEDWSIDQVLKDAALKTRESLGMPEYKEEDLPSSNKAAFAKGSSGVRTKTEKISALQQELDEL